MVRKINNIKLKNTNKQTKQNYKKEINFYFYKNKFNFLFILKFIYFYFYKNK